MPDRTITELDEAESLKLISPGGIGRIAYQSRFGPAVLPVNYKWHDGAVVFRTAQHSALDEDLQTGIAGGDYLVAFEIDEIDEVGRQGWSVLIQGPAHHVEGETERASAEKAGVEPWPAGERELFLRIVPHRVTGRRIHPASPPVTSSCWGDGHHRFLASAISACVRSAASSRATRSFCAAASQAACRAAARSTLSCSASRSALTSRFRMPTASRLDRATYSSTWPRS